MYSVVHAHAHAHAFEFSSSSSRPTAACFLHPSIAILGFALVSCGSKTLLSLPFLLFSSTTPPAHPNQPSLSLVFQQRHPMLRISIGSEPSTWFRPGVILTILHIPPLGDIHQTRRSRYHFDTGVCVCVCPVLGPSLDHPWVIILASGPAIPILKTQKPVTLPTTRECHSSHLVRHLAHRFGLPAFCQVRP